MATRRQRRRKERRRFEHNHAQVRAKIALRQWGADAEECLAIAKRRKRSKAETQRIYVAEMEARGHSVGA